MEFKKEFEEFKKSKETFLAILYNPKDNNTILELGLKAKDKQKELFMATGTFYLLMKINRKVINLAKVPSALADNTVNAILVKGKVNLIPLQGSDEAS